MTKEERVAIVTGAGRGIGRTIALALGATGIKVAVNDLNPDKAERTADEIRGAGGEAVAVSADIGNKFQCVHIVESTREKWGQLDILVNATDIQPSASIIKLDEWDWDRCIEINLKAVFMMTQLVGRVMEWENADRGGLIVNVGSEAGVNVPLAGKAAYCAAQAGMVGFTRECAREFGEFGVRVEAVLQDINGEDFAGTAAAVMALVEVES